ncbi:metal ABC transporter permease [Erysipelothrix urinaevulpis]|uniref:metal ABC transporter permease n=1 Tax=Erysipelothrix urinaevulpis TaxID=2683717 RepID=UPI001356A73F|nr:metal ABC transporter permease [Erysipelothrix urinaevulpis]
MIVHLTFLNDIVQYEFLQKALFTAVMVGILAGVMGSFIILRGMALMGDAISHAILPGVALSYMLGINYFIGAVVMGVLSSVGIGFVSQNSKLKNDTAIGIVFSAFFALGILLLMKAQTAVDLTQILFGNVLTVRSSDMWLTFGVGIFVLVCIFVFYKEFLITSFDATMAKSYGMNTNAIHYFMMILLTLVTVASLQTVGVVLVVAMLITPAATAYLLTNKMSKMIGLSAIFGALSAVIGLYFSFRYNLTSGAVIVLVATSFFIVAFLFAPKQGVVWNKLKQSKA